MATETIKVKQLSKFGVQLQSGEYVNWHKEIKDAEKGKVVPGGEYEVEMFRAESGKGYIQSIAKSSDISTIVAPVFNDTPVAKPLEKKSTEVKTDWAAKDRSQMIGGRSHDAAMLAAAAATANVGIEKILSDYKIALKAIVSMSEEIK